VTAPHRTPPSTSADVVYSAAPELRALDRFFSGARADLRVAPSVAWQLFLRRTQAAYRQSWLGYLWLLLPPLATTAAWLFLAAARVIAVPAMAMPYPGYVLSGILLWQLFAEALVAPLQQLSTARDARRDDGRGQSREVHEVDDVRLDSRQ
jgi:lipopolysaccharide transport system permease protein